jgi:hypothetical protein
MSKIKKALVSVTAAVMLALGLVAFVPAGDVSACSDGAIGQIGCGAKQVGESGGLGDSLITILDNVVNVLFFIIGFTAVAILVYGGVQYIISAGNASKVERAKSTILWAVIGLIICIASWAIVNFILMNVGGEGSVNSESDSSSTGSESGEDED